MGVRWVVFREGHKPPNVSKENEKGDGKESAEGNICRHVETEMDRGDRLSLYSVGGAKQKIISSGNEQADTASAAVGGKNNSKKGTIRL
jgi:hypothetical protein